MKNRENTAKDKVYILEVCQKLLNLKVLREIETHQYSVHCLVELDNDGNEDIIVRDRIKQNFENMGYRVEILGSLWLEIFFEDIEKMIDDCFKEGD